MTALEYSRWRNYKKIINKSKISCNVSNNNVNDHFADVGKMVPMPIQQKNHIKSLLLKKLIRTQHVGNSDMLDNKKAISNKIEDKEKNE